MDSQGGVSVAPYAIKRSISTAAGDKAGWAQVSQSALPIRFACKVAGFIFAEWAVCTLLGLNCGPTTKRPDTVSLALGSEQRFVRER